jgi:UDP-N-acetylglucosamine 2-epimerase (non-hydrolysing)
MKPKPFTLVTLLGIRPDIIRMHELLRLLDAGQEQHGYRHVFVHSGQHFDYELDEVFYEQLAVRKPDVNFGIGRRLKRSGKTDHVHQSGLLFEKTAEMLDRLRPSAVLYLGDTNTVLSSIVVARANVPVIHIEGGGRSYDWRMPEEKNRITIDHLSDLIYCYLDRYKEILLAEGISEYRIQTVGNIIVDAIETFLPAARKTRILNDLGLEERGFVLCTLHREENIESKEILEAKISGLACLSKQIPVVFPVMPRVKKRLGQYGLADVLRRSRVIQTRPLGFLEFLRLEETARTIVTDSGTVQEEALILGVPCVVWRRSTERPETIAAGATLMSDGDLLPQVKKAMRMKTSWDKTVLNPLGGSPSERIYADLARRIRSGFFAHSRSFETVSQNLFARQACGLELGSIRLPLATQRNRAPIQGTLHETRDTSRVR